MLPVYHAETAHNAQRNMEDKTGRKLTLHVFIASEDIGSCAIVDRMNRGEQFPCKK